MTNPSVMYYISSGEKNAMRTLRRVTNVPGTHYQDEYICNLARDHYTAIEKARSICGKNTLHASFFELSKWGEKNVKLQAWQKKAIQGIENGFITFGKHKGTELVNLEEGYVRFWILGNASNIVASHLIKALTKIAEDRGWLEKWQKAQEELEAKKKKEAEESEHFGNIGQRGELFLRCDKSLAFDGYYGMTYINICKTRQGHTVIYRGSKRWEEGKYYKVAATIKSHDVYEKTGVKQTYIARPTVKDVIDELDTTEV